MILQGQDACTNGFAEHIGTTRSSIQAVDRP